MSITITTSEFKNFFPRFTPVYLPVYEVNKVYFKDDIVFYENLFYKCKHDNVTTLPTENEDWQVVKGEARNYTQDSDIENAIKEALVNFNEELFDDDSKKLILLYLVAYYLTLDFGIALGQVNGGIVQSKSVGSVSESYGVPQWILQDRILGMYAKNGYGMKYLSLIQPYLIGNVMFFKGATTI